LSTGEDVTVHVEHDDLRFLGIAAALSARWRTLRKGGNDTVAVQQLLAGMVEGARLPLDDVPYITISVDTDLGTYLTLREIAPADKTWRPALHR
jgi:hypothetical protein